MFLAEACVVSAVIYACTTFGLLVFFSWGIPQLQSDWSLSRDHGLDYGSYCRTMMTTRTNTKGSFWCFDIDLPPTMHPRYNPISCCFSSCHVFVPFAYHAE